MSGSAPLSPAVAAAVIAQGPRLRDAMAIHAEMSAVAERMTSDRDRFLVLAYQLGEKLSAMKEDIGHGRWIAFIEGKWPDLSAREAQRCMAFFKENAEANAKSADSAHLTFSVDSIRKLLWHTIPAKERPQLAGDEKMPPANHHLTLVNGFAKYVRQIKVGVAARAPLDQMRRDFEPMVRQQAELLGREWLLQLLETLPAV